MSDANSIFSSRFRVRTESVMAFFSTRAKPPYLDKVHQVSLCLKSGHTVHAQMTDEELDMVSHIIGHGHESWLELMGIEETKYNEMMSKLGRDFGQHLDEDGL